MLRRCWQVHHTETVLAARSRRVYSNAHTYHINSVAVNSDQATFLSADDLRINLWNLEVTDQSFNIVDIKPGNMEDLTEVRDCAWAPWGEGNMEGLTEVRGCAWPPWGEGTRC
jgi:hypothetical protein